MIRFGEFCEERGALSEAAEWYGKAAECGPVEAKRKPRSPRFQVELGPYEFRLAWLRGDFVEEDCASLHAIAHLGALRARQGSFAEAERLLRRAASYGQMNDLRALAAFLLAQGNERGLGDWCAQAARAGRFDAIVQLRDDLAESGAALLAQRVSSYAVDAWRTESGGYLARSAADHAEADAEEEPYLAGTAEVIALSVEATAAADRTGLCGPVIGVVSMLSGQGTSRELLRVAGAERLLSEDAVPPETLDEAISRLTDASLLTCSGDGSVVTGHRLVTRLIRQRLADGGGLTAVGARACYFLHTARTLADPVENRSVARAIAQHAIALNDHLAPHLGDEDGALAESLVKLCGWAFNCLIALGDSVHALEFGEGLLAVEQVLADFEHVLGQTHPHTLTARYNLASTYRHAGRFAEALPLTERVLGEAERILGHDHPTTGIIRAALSAAGREAAEPGESMDVRIPDEPGHTH